MGGGLSRGQKCSPVLPEGGLPPRSKNGKSWTPGGSHTYSHVVFLGLSPTTAPWQMLGKGLEGGPGQRHNHGHPQRLITSHHTGRFPPEASL